MATLRQRLVQYWLLSLLAVGLSACGPARQQPEIRIGVLASFSGAGAINSGNATMESANLAAQQINNAGGLDINGVKHKITLVFGDDENNPGRAVDAARKLLLQDTVVALIGPQYSSNAIPVASVAEMARVPMISPMSTNARTTADKQFVFRVGFVDDAQGKALASFAQQEFNARRGAVLYDIASDYNRGMAETFKRQFEANGGTIVAFEAYTTGTTDFRAALQRIQEASPAVLFLPNYSADAIAQATQAREIGITASILGSDGWTSMRVATVPALQGAFFTQHWHIEVQNPQSQRFVADYLAAYQREPLETAALTYDAFQLLFLAMQQQKSSAPEQIQRGLASITAYEGVSGTIGYHGTGDPVKAVMIVQINDGKSTFYKLVKP